MYEEQVADMFKWIESSKGLTLSDREKKLANYAFQWGMINGEKND